MRVRTTPWARNALSHDDYGTLRTMLPDEYSLMLSATGPRGPYRATLGTTLLPPSFTGGGNLASSWAQASPMAAAMDAIQTAAGDGSQPLADRLADSIRLLGIEPKAVAS